MLFHSRGILKQSRFWARELIIKQVYDKAREGPIIAEDNVGVLPANTIGCDSGSNIKEEMLSTVARCGMVIATNFMRLLRSWRQVLFLAVAVEIV